MIYVIIASAWSVIYWVWRCLPGAVDLWPNTTEWNIGTELILIVSMLAATVCVFAIKEYRIPIKIAAPLNILSYWFFFRFDVGQWFVIVKIMLSVIVLTLAVIDLVHENKLADMATVKKEQNSE